VLQKISIDQQIVIVDISESRSYIDYKNDIDPSLIDITVGL